MFFGTFLNAKGRFYYHKPEDGDIISLKGDISLKGRAIFAGVNRHYSTEVTINSDGEIDSFSFSSPGKDTVLVKKIKNQEDQK